MYVLYSFECLLGSPVRGKSFWEQEPDDWRSHRIVWVKILSVIPMVCVCISRAWKTLRHWWPMYLNWAVDLASLKCCGVFLPLALNSTLPHAAPERKVYIVLEIFNQIFQPKDKWCFSVLNKALPWQTIPLDSFQKHWKIKG